MPSQKRKCLPMQKFLEIKIRGMRFLLLLKIRHVFVVTCDELPFYKILQKKPVFKKKRLKVIKNCNMIAQTEIKQGPTLRKVNGIHQAHPNLIFNV